MLQGLMVPLRLVLQRSFADWLIVAATWLVILCATVLVAIGVLYGDAVALTGLQQAIRDEPPAATAITVELRASHSELAEIEPTIEQQVGRILGWTGGELITVTHSETYSLPEQSEEGPTGLALFGAYESIDRHASLVDGRFAAAGADPMEVAISQPTADRLGIAVGDVLELASQRGGDRTISVELVGIWRPNDADDPYWRADPLELNGATEGASFTTNGPFVGARQDVIERTASGNLGLQYRALPNFERLSVADVRWMRSDTAALDRRLADGLGERVNFQVSTQLDAILADVSRSLLVSRSGVGVLTIQYAVLAGYALLLVAGLLFEQRRVETALLRSRGAGVGHVVLMSFLEALVLVVPAVVVAPWLAVAALGLLNVAGPLADAGITIHPEVTGGVWIATIVAGVAAIAGLVLPALGSGRGLSMVRQSLARQGNRSLAQRLGIDLALVVLAGVGLWQLRQYGAPLTETVRGEFGLDPLLVAAPAIGLLAGAIVALRLVPLAAEIGERLLVRRRGLVAPLGARQVSRRPLRYTRSALLLMLAAALGTFAGAYASTWTRSQADQAAYRTGADVRVTVSEFPELPAWAIGQAYRSVEGVDAALPVARDGFDVAGGNGHLLALDAATAADIITLRADLAARPIDRLLATTLSETPGGAPTIPIEGEPRFLALELAADLAPIPDPPAPEPGDPEPPSSAPLSPSFRGIVPELLVGDRDGLVQRLRASRGTVGGSDQRIVIELAGEDRAIPSAPAYPLELVGAEITIQLPEGVIAAGSVELVAIESAESADGPWTPIELAPTSWAFETSEPILGGADVPPTVVATETVTAETVPIPALAGAAMLDQMGIAVGDTIDVGSLGVRRPFRITGTLDAFPTLDPNAPFLVADLATLAAHDAAEGRSVTADEWWLDVADDRARTVAEDLRGDPYSAEAVLAYDELHADLLGDPVALGMIGSLALGALAAVVFAAIGFVVSATVSTRERLGEFALLQAIGLSHRQLSGWLSMENAFLLLIGLLAGTGVGLVLAWVVLPFVTLTQQASLAVPPVEVVIPWGTYVLLYLAAGVALAITVVVIGNLLARVRVSGVLRSGGE